MDFILDQLSALPTVRARKMFGEYALYCEEKVVALVCDNQLFVKITPAGKKLVGERYEEGEAYPGAKPSMVIDAIRVTASVLPTPKPRRARKTKTR
jgi:TfoX/Sxy family transcriptional regulator of competence genes